MEKEKKKERKVEERGKKLDASHGWVDRFVWSLIWSQQCVSLLFLRFWSPSILPRFAPLGSIPAWLSSPIRPPLHPSILFHPFSRGRCLLPRLFQIYYSASTRIRSRIFNWIHSTTSQPFHELVVWTRWKLLKLKYFISKNIWFDLFSFLLMFEITRK